MSATQKDFKQAMAQWPSGVTLVTSFAVNPDPSGPRLPRGMTVSAFFSASLSPLLLGVCLDNASHTLATILESRRFAVNILSENQQSLSNRFATPGNESQRFDGVPLLVEPDCSSPLLCGALVHLDCKLHSTSQTGDHTLLLGEPTTVLRHDGSPLVFQASKYRALESEATDKGDSGESSD